MSKISVYIIAFNEAEKVAATIESARWADEIIVVDSWSTDSTAEIASQLGARVVQVKFQGFGDLRNQALAACTHDWIFSLDADERCTVEAAQEIRSVVNDPNALDAYWMPRRNFQSATCPVKSPLTFNFFVLSSGFYNLNVMLF